MNRIDALQSHIDQLLLEMPDASERRWAYLHLYGVAQACALIALKRGEDAELATMAAMLHDLYRCTASAAKSHAQKGAVLAREILNKLGFTTDAETELICSSIHHHSEKSGAFSGLTEILIDADVMEHCLYNVTLPVDEKEKDRFHRLMQEFGIRNSGCGT